MWSKGEPLLKKLSMVARFGVLPGAMIAALLYSPPDYSMDNNTKTNTKN